jgi:mono/diheme cytochrome c family protein
VKVAMAMAVALVVAMVLTLAMPQMVLGGGDAEKGKAVYAGKCKMCHGAEGEGNPGMAKMMKVEMKALGSKEVQAMKDAEIKKDIADGNGKMKPVKLTDEEAANVIAYIRTLKK